MAAKLAGAVAAGAVALLLSVSRHAVAIANHLDLVRGVSMQELALLARVFGAASFVLLFVLPFVVGYAVATRIDFAADYPAMAAALGLGGGLGYLAGSAVIVPLTTVTPGLLATATLLLATAIAVAIEVAIVGFAGGALAYVRGPARAPRPG